MAGRAREAHMMPDHHPFDGTVPFVTKMSPYLEPRRWAGCPRIDDPRGNQRFATWREAMNYVTKEDH